MSKEYVSRDSTHDLPEREGDPKLTWNELVALANDKGYYMAAMTDFNNSGQRADFFCLCMNDRFPMYQSELTSEQREVLHRDKELRKNKKKSQLPHEQVKQFERELLRPQLSSVLKLVYRHLDDREIEQIAGAAMTSILEAYKEVMLSHTTKTA